MDFSEFDSNERNKLFKRAKRLFEASHKQTSTKRAKLRPNHWEKDLDEILPERKVHKHKEILRLMQEISQTASEEPELSEDQNQEIGLVAGLAPQRAKVIWQNQELECHLTPEIAKRQHSSIAVGDRVLLENKSDTWIVSRVMPRKTSLSRPDPGNVHLERVLVANVDLVIIVSSVMNPPLRPGLIDRFLIAIERGKASPLICLNKIDLLQTEEDRRVTLKKLKPYQDLGIPIVWCSASTQEGIAELKMHMRGKTCAFVGHSGVGKSSLLNAAHPDLALLTGQVSGGNARGRHTTTASALVQLEQDIVVIDTPGIRSLGLEGLKPTELRWYFPEFEAMATACKFRDCLHLEEPSCAVRTAAESGQIARYHAYLSLLASAQEA